MAALNDPLSSARRLVVKIGSALLVDGESGRLRRDWLHALADDIRLLRERGVQVAVVSSGSIALGRRVLGLGGQRMRLVEKQAAAAAGQIRLAHAYQEAMARHGIAVAQILLTLQDTEIRRHYLNARSTVDTLLKLATMPVINENDTVATEEIRYGDNDRLAARVAQMISADTLVLLSDIDGLYTADPGVDKEATFIPRVERLTPEILAMAGAARSDVGSGGMVTKLEAARIAMEAGCHMAIARGTQLHPLSRLMEGTSRCTWFMARSNPAAARKQWIAGGLQPSGHIRIDAGAVRALNEGKSLLPAGVVAVEGDFQRGDAVVVADEAGTPLARGLVAYNSRDARVIAGHKSGEIGQLLGYRGRDEIIHRDDLVLLNKE